jgi:hypothetical protein
VSFIGVSPSSWVCREAYGEQRRRVGIAADYRRDHAVTPYPLWCTFATVMSTDIWRLNR